MKIEKHLNWAPSFKNQIDISTENFIIEITDEVVDITCQWDYGWGGRGSEYMSIPLFKLKELIAEVENSKK